MGIWLQRSLRVCDTVARVSLECCSVECTRVGWRRVEVSCDQVHHVHSVKHDLPHPAHSRHVQTRRSDSSDHIDRGSHDEPL